MQWLNFYCTTEAVQMQGSDGCRVKYHVTTALKSMDVGEAVVKAGAAHDWPTLKEDQVLCITKFVEGNDVFCILPTGYGKTACFACLPTTFDLHLGISSPEESSIVIVISPLTALIKDQVKDLTRRNVNVGFLDAESVAGVKSDVIKGNYSLVLLSPEMIMGKWRSLLLSKVYQERLVGVVVDEAHCVVKW